MRTVRAWGQRSVLLVVTTVSLAVAVGGASSVAAPTPQVTWAAYDHARVVGVVDGAGGRVALTFDDCGDPAAWRSILATLAAHHTQAAFFCIAREVRDHVAVARRTFAGGNMLCNHTWSHPELTALGDLAIASQLRLARNVIYGLTGSRCGYMRPPYGSYDRRVLTIAGSLGYRWATLWTVDPRDWAQPGVDEIVSRVLRATDSGSIVLLHVMPQTAAALPRILGGLSQRGLRPVLLRTLVAAGSPAAGGWPRF